MGNQGKKVLIVVCVVIGVAALSVAACGAWVIRGLNNAVALDESVNQSWAQVENQLQRRHDLVPNLVNIVKGYMKHEKELLTKVTELRSQWGKATTQTEKMTTANAMGAELSKLLLVVERYPNLKADDQCRVLQAQLEGTENRISVERMRYNQSVQAYNQYAREVLGSFFVQVRGLESKRNYFEITKAVKELPKVEL